MKNVLRAFALLCGLTGPALYARESSIVEVATRASCAPSSKEKSCRKQIAGQKKVPAQNARQAKQKNTPEVSMPTAPLAQTSGLSRKQDEMREAFMECIGKSTQGNPVNAVREFVFWTQQTHEDGGLRSFLRALRGSSEHHAHEICLARAYGLRGYRSNLSILENEGGLLVPIASTYVDVDENEIRDAYRRVARIWVRDYLRILGEDMFRHFSSITNSGGSFSVLRVTSSVRSFDEQAVIVRQGKSPADCRYHFLCSSHTTASGVDLGLRNLNPLQRAWLEKRLVEDQRAQKIFFIRENSHFHVFVLPTQFMGEE